MAKSYRLKEVTKGLIPITQRKGQLRLSKAWVTGHKNPRCKAMYVCGQGREGEDGRWISMK